MNGSIVLSMLDLLRLPLIRSQSRHNGFIVVVCSFMTLKKNQLKTWWTAWFCELRACYYFILYTKKARNACKTPLSIVSNATLSRRTAAPSLSVIRFTKYFATFYCYLLNCQDWSFNIISMQNDVVLFTIGTALKTLTVVQIAERLCFPYQKSSLKRISWINVCLGKNVTTRSLILSNKWRSTYIN